jgi:hypothetical protein
MLQYMPSEVVSCFCEVVSYFMEEHKCATVLSLWLAGLVIMNLEISNCFVLDTLCLDSIFLGSICAIFVNFSNTQHVCPGSCFFQHLKIFSSIILCWDFLCQIGALISIL